MEVQKKALSIVRTLRDAGFIAYFAGGWVRDKIMGSESDDIDIATDASPDEILKLFSKTVKVGVSFGVVVVLLDGDQFEVATFRKDIAYTNGRTPTEIEFCSPKEDALRRDFTINGLFYDPITDETFDYVEGIADIGAKIIRTIGNPRDRFIEDRLRMVRAFRFASRLGFSIDSETSRAIFEHADTLFPSVSPERIWQEFTKMAKFPGFGEAFIEMQRCGLLSVIFPELKGISPEEIADRVAFFSRFPSGSPAILYLVQLFPEAIKEEMFALARYLRTSKNEIRYIETYFEAKKLVSEEKEGRLDPVAWVHYFAGKNPLLFLEIIAANLPEHERENSRRLYIERVQNFEKHIQRIVEGKPLVTGKLLQDSGIAPGEKMGRLLEEAERFSIVEDIHDTEKVLNYLKTVTLWEKKSL